MKSIILSDLYVDIHVLCVLTWEVRFPVPCYCYICVLAAFFLQCVVHFVCYCFTLEI